MAALVSMSNLLNGKDSRWLQLEVCREFQRNKCSRPDTECKFAHPPANVEVQNGRVTACYDSIKGRCNREKPPCKYFHPPQHLKDQLLINGRNHLALKNALMQQMGMAPPTPTPTILPSPLQPITANRYVTASNPYNPYFGPGLLPMQIGPDHAATALPHMSAAANAGAHPQKRTERVQMDQMKFMGPYYEHFTFSGLMPYKRPAPENKSYPIYQPSAAAYQQLMQLQSQQPYVPVSCEYTSSQNHASVDTITYPSNPNATLSNLQQTTFFSQTCNPKNNFNTTSTFFADADAQIKSQTAQQNSPSKVIPSNNIEHNNTPSDLLAISTLSKNTVGDAAAADGDSENVLTMQNAKINVSGCDDVVAASSSSPPSHDENIKSMNEVILTSLVDDEATQLSSIQSTDENNLNANSFNSATSSSTASLAALYTTSSIANNNNNNSILSRKNSLTTPNQHLINSSKAPTCYTNTLSAKVDTVPDYLSASSLNNHPQAALLSAMLYNQPYQQLEMAQKSYANALKLAVVQQNSNVANKSQLAMPYSGVALSANNNLLQPGTSATRLPSAMGPSTRSPFIPALSRPLQNPFQQFMNAQGLQPSMMQVPQMTSRPQMPAVNLAAATNYYAAAAAHQQFLSQQNLIYSGLSNSLNNQQMTASSIASTPTQYATSSYPFSMTQAQAINAQGLQASMMQVPPQSAQTGNTPLNPYKKMKTS